MRFEIKTQINKEAVNRRMVAQELTDDLSYCFTVIAWAPSLLFSPSSSCSILWEQEREEGVREENKYLAS